MIQNYFIFTGFVISPDENSENGKHCSNPYNHHPHDRFDLCVSKIINDEKF
jgi:hypothetical protein